MPHCSELSGLLLRGAPPNPNTEQGYLDTIMATSWLSFITSGDPNPRDDFGDPNPRDDFGDHALLTSRTDASVTTAWPPYTRAQDNNIVFALKSAGGVHVESKYRKDECDYWDTLPGGPDN